MLDTFNGKHLFPSVCQRILIPQHGDICIETTNKYDNSAQSVGMRFAQSILRTGWNITVDNYFTSHPLPAELQQTEQPWSTLQEKNKIFFRDIAVKLAS